MTGPRRGPTPAGYTVTADGAAAWLPAESWTAPLPLTAPGATPAQRAAAIEAHAARVATRTTRPTDWPRFLVQFAPGQGPERQSWRRVPLGPRGHRLTHRISWHRTLVQALFIIP